MKLKHYINEERLHSKDKRAIIGFIKSPPKAKTANNGVKFIHDKDDFELVTTLVDIADSLGGYKFSTKPGVFTVVLK